LILDCQDWALFIPMSQSQQVGHWKKQFVALTLLGEVWCPSLYDSWLTKKEQWEGHV